MTGPVPLDAATLAQVRAADPAQSSWVAANAGSGKTRVLTDRVARLLLQDVPPQHILCLTYTKAAAANMQNTLLRRLGAWAMLDDAPLAAELARLGLDADCLTPDFLARARTLFAQALETPGGLKIQTIHAFCAAILRRFPVEAGVPPGFAEMDDRAGALLRADILDRMALEGEGSPFARMAQQLAGGDVHRLVADILTHRDAFLRSWTPEDLKAALGIPAGISDTGDVARLAFDGSEPGWFPHAIAILSTDTSQTARNLADALQQIDPTSPAGEAFDALAALVLYASGDSRGQPKFKSVPPRKAQKALEDAGLLTPLQQFMERVAKAHEIGLRLAALPRMIVLYEFATAFLAEYDAAKQRHGWLDFDDLILKTRDLLKRSERAQWVLYRLDGGIDHILVDEAQDTSPRQWEVIAALADEFLAGEGAREVPRSLFVVGDEKQSIYSFQGADPDAFQKMRHLFDERLQAQGRGMQPHDLLYSFRSAQAILSFVDVTLQDRRLLTTEVRLEHRAFFEQLPGRVDLWPFIEPSETPDTLPWHAPMDMPAPDAPENLLARQVVRTVDHMLRHETLPRAQGGARRVRPSDIMILVQRRGPVFHAIIRALKDAGLPVAGADRLRIGGELAVRDLMAVLKFVATPADDLSLASALRSPLFGLDEAALFDLAHGRKGTLWQALRGAEPHAEARDILNDLLAHADFLRPYEMLERLLIRWQGRRRLLARLGPEAEDGIDALLHQALAHEAAEIPTLTGFVTWMESDDSEIKRQPDTDSDEIRVMTVHGAKGLESPVVILPDTAPRQIRDNAVLRPLENGHVGWKGGPGAAPAPFRDAAARARQREEEERMRLLYVALTRAECWLVVCGAGNRSGKGPCWYDVVEQGLAQLDTETVEICGVPVTRYQPLAWSEGAPDADATPPDTPELPAWALTRASAPAPAPAVLNPSHLGDDAASAGPAGSTLDPEAALRRGRQVHALLEHLPGRPPEDREEAARAVLRALDGAVDDAECRKLLTTVSAILDDPGLAFLFAPGTLAEVPIAGRLHGRPLHGIIDRLVIAENRVLAVDYKTHAAPPGRVQDVPEGILAQLGAYAHVLADLYPGRRVETAILWTETGRLMPLPADLVSGAVAQPGLLDAPSGET